MKIKLNPNYGVAGNIALIIILVIIVLIIGGCSVYYLRKFARRLDQPSQPPPQTNNTSEIMSPPPGIPENILFLSKGHWYVEYTNSFNLNDGPPVPPGGTNLGTTTNYVATNPPPTPTIIVRLSNGQPVLAITNAVDWTNQVNFSNYMDSAGLPMQWEYEGLDGQPVDIERCDCGTNWVWCMTVYVQPNKGAIYRDTDPYTNRLYRAKLP